MFERSERGERAILVHPEISDDRYPEALDEFVELAESADVEVLGVITARRDRPDAALFIGTGKAEEVAAEVRRTGADLVLVNHQLSPVQERNLERALSCRVHDRTTLILDIFAQRAASHEGKLQVELAQLRHMSTRLVRGWTHLERQKGGIGLRGPGETQLETDRRLLGERVKHLNRRLEKLDRQREQTRRGRQRGGTALVSLVGYTNAGKSTLFNALTHAGTLAANQLFATLDPTVRRLDDGGEPAIVLADTVGFIRHLPHELVAAFRATLQESRDADLLLHVVDASAPNRDALIGAVDEVLDNIGASDVPQIRVYNKIDLTDLEPRVQRDDSDEITAVWISAQEGRGLDLLNDAIHEKLHGQVVERWFTIPAGAGRLRARLFDMGAVVDESSEPDGTLHMKLRLRRDELDHLQRQPGGENLQSPG